MSENFLKLEDLLVYKAARKLEMMCWDIFNKLTWQNKKVLGDQFITAVDSIGANIAEGFGRYHYLDKIKFYYNARGSLLESRHWTEILFERKIISTQEFNKLIVDIDNLHHILNAFIKSARQVVK